MIEPHLRDLKRRGYRPNTIAQRRDRLRAFTRDSGLDLATTTRDGINAYLDGFDHPQTRLTYLSHLRAFYKWALTEELLTVDPTSGIPTPRVHRRLPRPISEADLTRAIDAAKSPVRTWLMLSAYAGLRACEIAPIRGEHIIRTGTPYLFIPVQKGGRQATVPLAAKLLAELEPYPREGWLWQSSGPMRANDVSVRSGTFLRALGIDATLHACRHRFGTQTYRASGHDLRMTQELMRHASPNSTALYTAVDPSEGSKVVDLLA